MSRVCKKCGGAVKEEDTFCMHCGMPLEKEEPKREGFAKEERMDNRAEVLSMGDYLLMLILLSIPVVNFIVCILWIAGRNGNPNRRNFAKAWMVIAVVGTILSGILAYGAFQFIVMDHYVSPDYQFQHTFPEEEMLENFFMEMDEI
ncbi:MAG: zinc ribbon domain-containing protein [Anaerotignum sp.]|nr:zinc ribbon domain-containing protein [Anaerotignum sp.]